jgi:hypothetical protein
MIATALLLWAGCAVTSSAADDRELIPHGTRAWKGMPVRSVVEVPETLVPAFERAWGFDPFSAKRLMELDRHAATVTRLPGFPEALEAGTAAVADPRNLDLRKTLSGRLDALAESAGQERFLPALFVVLRDSMAEQHMEKRYWIEKLQEYDALSAVLEEHHEELRQARLQLLKSRGTGEQTVRVELKEYDLELHEVRTPKIHEPAGRVRPVSIHITSLGKGELEEEIAGLEADQERVQRWRAMCATHLDSTNLQTARTLNMMVSVLRSVKKAHPHTIRKLR